MNEREIFLQAKSMPQGPQREAILEQACRGDLRMRQRVESLLAADEQTGNFLNLPETETSPDGAAEERVGSTIGPYRLLEQIGEGGFGVVYRAEQTQPVRRTVAVKVIKPGMDSRQVIARFEAERQALAMMEHPHIAKVFDAGTTETGRPYFVMELVKGIPITTFCDERRWTLKQRLELMVAVCQAIQHAHSKGVIHRDIKPSNVLVATYDEAAVVKVIDFGIAKAAGQPLTERTLHTGYGAIVGSLEYMGPEQASFNQLDVDTRSDVYSLGVLLYELLAGSPPLTSDRLQRDGLLETLRTIRESEPPPPSSRLSTSERLASLAATRAIEPARLTSSVRGELDWIAMKALAKDRNRRYETASALAEELNRFLQGQPVSAHPPSRFYLLRKWAWRNRWQVSMAASLLLVAGLAWLWFYASSAAKARARWDHTVRVSTAIDEASAALGAAVKTPVGRQAEWVAARAAVRRLQELMAMQPSERATAERADALLNRFRQADTDRKLAEQIEGVVMMSATHPDLQSWESMERQFRVLFRQYGIDLDKLPAAEVAQRIRADRSADQLSDALELWIGTRGQISAMGGAPATRDNMQPWADAMIAADDDPVRQGIRRLLYAGAPPAPEAIDKLVEGVSLTSLSSRTLSWLGNLYAMAGNRDAADRVFHLAALHYPDDFMLNFDFAYMLAAQERLPDAIRYYIRCAGIRPDVPGIWRALGIAYRDNDELLRSRDALQRAVDLEPKHGPSYVDLAETCLLLGDFVSAENAARAALRMADESSRAQALLGRALLGSEKYAAALIAFEACQQLNESQPRQAVDVAAWVNECRKQLSGGQGADDD